MRPLQGLYCFVIFCISLKGAAAQRPICVMKGVFVALNGECDKYARCDGKDMQRSGFLCPQGQLFDPFKHKCLPPDQVTNCQVCFGKEGHRFRVTNRDDKFYQCVDGTPIQMLCKTTSYFDPGTMKCVKRASLSTTVEIKIDQPETRMRKRTTTTTLPTTQAPRRKKKKKITNTHQTITVIESSTPEPEPESPPVVQQASGPQRIQIAVGNEPEERISVGSGINIVANPKKLKAAPAPATLAQNEPPGSVELDSEVVEPVSLAAGVQGAVKPVLGAVGGVLNGVLGTVNNVAGTNTKSLVGPASKGGVKSSGGSILDPVVGLLNNVAGAATQTVNNVAGSVNTNGGLLGAVDQTLNNVVGTGNTKGGLLGAVGQTVNNVAGAVNTNGGLLGAVDQTLNNVVGAVKSKGGLLGAVDQTLNNVVGTGNTKGGLLGSVGQTVNNVAGAVNPKGGLLGAVGQTVNNVAGAVNTGGLLGALGQTVNNLGGTVNNVANGLKSTVVGATDYLTDATKGSLTASGDGTMVDLSGVKNLGGKIESVSVDEGDEDAQVIDEEVV